MSAEDHNQGVLVGLAVRWVIVYVITAFCLLILTTYTGALPVLATGFYIVAGLGALINMGLRR